MWGIAIETLLAGVVAAIDGVGLLKMNAASQEAGQKIVSLEQSKVTPPEKFQLDNDVFMNSLKGKPKEDVRIRYVENGEYSWRLALALTTGLTNAGWTVIKPSPTVLETNDPLFLFLETNVPFLDKSSSAEAFGSTFGTVAIVEHDDSEYFSLNSLWAAQTNRPSGALKFAIMEAGSVGNQTPNCVLLSNSNVSPNLIELIHIP